MKIRAWVLLCLLVCSSVLSLWSPANASFTAAVPRNDYVGNNATAVYAYTFRIFEAADLKVTEQDTDGDLSTLVLNTDYTVSGVGAHSGGNVTLTAGNLATGHLLTIRFSGATKQPIDLRNQGGIYPETIEDGLDRLGRYIQKNDDGLSRSYRIPDIEVGTEAKTLLPVAASRANKFFSWDADGNPVAAAGTSADLGPVSVFINTLLDDTTAAAARTTLGAINKEPSDADFRVVGSSDATKKAAFEVDGLTTATTRTVTVPDRNITLGTALMTPIATTSGNTHDFTGIPSGVREITVSLNGVSGNGTSNWAVQIGDAGGIENTGYISLASEVGGASSSTTSSFLLTNSITSATFVTGTLTLTLENASTNTWVARGTFIEETVSVIVTGGKKSLSATLDRVRLTMTGADTFDAGEVNVSYKY